MSEIKTKIFEFGHEKEGSWPPKYGTGEVGAWHVDRETNSMKEGYAPRRSKFADAPYVKGDEALDGIKSQTGSGCTYYSKSALRAEYKRMGFEEVGNDYPRKPRERYVPPTYEKDLEKDVARAIEDVRYNQAPLSEFDKERCKIINNQVEKSNDVRIRDDAKR